MILNVLVPLAWIFWAILLVAMLVITVMMVRGTQPSPQGGEGFCISVIVLLNLLLMGAGWLLYYFTQSQSQGGIITMAVVFGYCVIMMVADPVVKAYQKWSFEREHARVGDFRDPVLRPLADAIRAGDGATLTRLLDGKPAPPGRDRAGHDLMGYALAALRDSKGPLDCVRALLEAGSDPNTTRMPDGLAPIHFMIGDITPSGREAVLLLLRHGADPDAVDPISGNTPINESGHSPELVRALIEAGADMDRVQSDGVTALVNFVRGWCWESARYLLERGARLDVANEDGLSLDYYLESWKESVFGEHQEGWDQLRAAIAARGKGLP